MARKRLRSFCQRCRWQVTPKHAYTLDASKSEWADYAGVQAECGNLSGNELTRNSSGNTRSQSSQLAEALWTDPGLKSGISLRELISTLNKQTNKKKCGREMNCGTFSRNPRTRGKSHPNHHHHHCCSKKYLFQNYEYRATRVESPVLGVVCLCVFVCVNVLNDSGLLNCM